MAELLENGNLKIEAYSFAEFLTDFEQAIINGFTLDLESNDNFPQKYGSHLYVVLIPTATEVVAEEETVVAEEETPEVDLTRTMADDLVESTQNPPEVVSEVAEPEVEPTPEAPKRTYNRKSK